MEEFSFPVIAMAVAQSCASPLWFQLPPEVDAAAAGYGCYAERMDLLWEDFNEELRRLSCEQTDGHTAAQGSGYCCTAAVDRRRRTRLVSILKAVLKKLLVILKSKSDPPPPGVGYRISNISD